MDTPLTKWGTNPTKLYDYMSAGRPVICSFNSPNLPIYDANCGYSIEAGHPEKIADALIEFSKLTEHEKYSMGLRGYDYAKEHFNSQKLAKKLENLFLEAVNRAT